LRISRKSVVSYSDPRRRRVRKGMGGGHKRRAFLTYSSSSSGKRENHGFYKPVLGTSPEGGGRPPFEKEVTKRTSTQ